MKNIAIVAFLSLLFVGCVSQKKEVTTELAQRDMLTSVNVKSSYVLAEDVKNVGVVHSAIVNFDFRSNIAYTELIFGSFMPNEKGRVVFKASQHSLVYKTVEDAVKELSSRIDVIPVCLFVQVNGNSMGVGDYQPGDEAMDILREFNLLMKSYKIEFAYVIPEKFTLVSKK